MLVSNNTRDKGRQDEQYPSYNCQNAKLESPFRIVEVAFTWLADEALSLPVYGKYSRPRFVYLYIYLVGQRGILGRRGLVIRVAAECRIDQHAADEIDHIIGDADEPRSKA